MKNTIRNKLQHRIPHPTWEDLEWCWSQMYPEDPIERLTRCERCNGLGAVEVPTTVRCEDGWSYRGRVLETCEDCNGVGYDENNRLPRGNGNTLAAERESHVRTHSSWDVPIQNGPGFSE